VPTTVANTGTVVSGLLCADPSEQRDHKKSRNEKWKDTGSEGYTRKMSCVVSEKGGRLKNEEKWIMRGKIIEKQ
jgi:hypothetical protein